MKNLLIISADFPPMGLGSVQRISKFVKYFPRYGWQPIVLTATPKFFYARDEYLLNEVLSAGAKIYRTPTSGRLNFLNDPRITPLPNEGRRRFKRKFRQSLYVTDSSPLAKGWQMKALRKAGEIFSSHKIDAMFATAPPFKALTIGCELKEKYKVPLVVDYRDSWTDNPFNFYPTPIHRFRNMKLEREVLRIADEVLTVNRRIKEKLIEKYPGITHHDIDIVPHSFDAEEIAAASASLLPRTNKMRFTYTGTLINYYNPEPALKAFGSLFSSHPELKTKIEVCFVGVFSKEDLKLIRQNIPSEALYVQGYVNHLECTKYLLASDVLWFTLQDQPGADQISPVKLYEFIGVKKPILACAPDGVVKASLRKYDAVKICEPDDAGAIEHSILEFYELFRKNLMPPANEEVIRPFDANSLTADLVRRLEFLLDLSPEIAVKSS